MRLERYGAVTVLPWRRLRNMASICAPASTR